MIVFEKKKENILRAIIEKDQIRKALIGLEKAKVTTLAQDRIKELEKLSAEREVLRQKEQELAIYRTGGKK